MPPPRPGRRATTAPADIPPKPPEDEAEEPERGPLRRCLVTRERLPKQAMLRFVLAPDRRLVPDLAERLPGRGMWLSARADVLEQAIRRGAFAKAARGEVFAPPDLRAIIADGLRGRIRDLVGFARRAGQAVSGWQAVREWLRAGRVGLLVQAADGSPAEKARLVGHRQLPVAEPLSGAELGAPFGRDRAVHVAIAPGRLAERIAAEAARLAGLSASSPETMPRGSAPPGGGRKPGMDPARPDQRAPRDADYRGRDGAAHGTK